MAHAPLKRQRANSLVHALRLCKEWAQAKRHLSVERIADRMGTTHDSLYKWLATGRMPAILIPAYELACGCHYVSEWLAASSGALVVPMPTGRKAEGTELLDMNSSCAAALQLLTQFYAAPQAADTEATLAALRLPQQLVDQVTLLAIAGLQLRQAVHSGHFRRGFLPVQHHGHRLGGGHGGAACLLGHAGFNLFVGEFSACHGVRSLGFEVFLASGAC